jgi:hypothetical protein
LIEINLAGGDFGVGYDDVIVVIEKYEVIFAGCVQLNQLE